MRPYAYGFATRTGLRTGTLGRMARLQAASFVPWENPCSNVSDSLIPLNEFPVRQLRIAAASTLGNGVSRERNALPCK
jgi:hypothetical protein